MTNWFSRGSGHDDLDRDVVLGEALRALDPASSDPNYWLRFRGVVMSRAARELSRRRRMVEMTVGDVLTAWARTLVPTAAFAAALAAIVLVRGQAETVEQAQLPPMGVEELLVSELPLESVPALLTPDAAAGLVVFASEIF